MFRFLSIAALIITLVSCQKKVDPFRISLDSVGHLNKSTLVKDIRTIFSNDSVVMRVAGDEFLGTSNNIEIYDKEGNPLLSLERSEAFDSIATIKTVQILDPRFKTEKGFGLSSTFKELKEQYALGKITNTLSLALVNIDTIGAYIGINKKELPKNLLFDTNSKIEVHQIPDEAAIKYLWLDWSE